MGMDLSVSELGKRIYPVRGDQVMLDSDLAVLYEIETFNLNKTVKRNRDQFPSDFLYQLTHEEWGSLTFQFGMSKNQGRGGRRTLPYGFTQEGVAMLSGLLNSDRAREVNKAILRTFARIRRSSVDVCKLTEKIERLGAGLNEQLAAMSKSLSQVMGAVTPVLERSSVILVNREKPQTPTLSNLSLQSVNDSFIQERPARVGEEVQICVAKYYEISIVDLKSPTRVAAISLPRQICMYLLREYTGFSYMRIGGILGGRDHATVLHGYRKIEIFCSTKGDIAEDLESIRSSLKAKGITPKGFH